MTAQLVTSHARSVLADPAETCVQMLWSDADLATRTRVREGKTPWCGQLWERVAERAAVNS
ncbi:MAG: hypothetical protein ACHP7F_12415 [Actinomycetales bacterium]|jgi:hypothetical protein